jgi:betaine-aldehyde dehydrogenase
VGLVIEHRELFIGGEWVRPSTGAVREVRSPATREVVGVVPEAAPKDLARAVSAARAAFDDGPWPHAPLSERAACLRRVGDALRARAAELDDLVPRESGIPACFFSGSSAIPLVDYYADLAEQYSLDQLRPGRPGVTGDGIVHKAPVGVVAGITPWNGPVMQVLMKLVPALLAGCPIVVKPAPETPLSALAVASAVYDAGIPAGLVSIIPGGKDLGVQLVDHPGVDHVSFTGSTAAGLAIAAQCGSALRRVNLELGGKSAAVLLEDLDLDVALPTVAQYGYFFNGEACAALTRVLAPRRRYDEIIERYCDIVDSYPVGDPLDPETFIGPLISDRQRVRVEDYIGIGRTEGAKIALGGGRPAGLVDGYYVEPTVFRDVDNSMRIAREEIFGPVVAVVPYDDVDDAVRIANDSPLGLAGAVFADDDAAALAVARRLRTGHVGINTLGMDWVLPFGGFKQSGVGRELGVEGLETYLELQCFGLPEGSVLGGAPDTPATA